MAIHISTPPFPPHVSLGLPSNYIDAATLPSFRRRHRSLRLYSQHLTTPQIEFPPRTSIIDKSLLSVSETRLESELWAATHLRVRTFYDFKEHTFGIEDHKRFLAEREFEALKERVAGKREGFRRVACINATLPVSLVLNISADLCASCKFSQNGEDRVVVGTLDLNQCMSLPDEMIGKKPEGIGADFARAYISNVCVAEELHRNGLGHQHADLSYILLHIYLCE